ncbi:MAG: S41 family peptidase [Bacteroidales bacterium]|nr:S41 family peptidase [Bacteroidales bacterium]
MTKTITKSLCTALLITFFVFNSKAQTVGDQAAKFSRVLSLIENYYVDTTNQEKLVEHAIIELLHKLDPHSIYISKEEVKAMNEPLEGNFEGIGVQFNILRDTIIVVAPISGGPSEKLGVKAGDRIIKIEDELVAGIGVKNKDVRDKLLGDKGTKVKISIQRKGEKKLLDFTITRDKIPIYSLDAAYMVNEEIGYIKLNRFAKTTMEEFNTAMEKLRDKGMKSLILDLQGNGGGFLQTSIELSDEFLDKDKLIVYTEGVQSPKVEYKSNPKGSFLKGKLVVLVDQSSASASEIVSGALQDWDRAVVIGRRTFGKGLVQRPFYLTDGAMIRLTIARYYTPTGRLIQKPYEDGYEEYTKDLINRYNSGELSSEDNIHFPDSLKYKTLVNKRIVYGGGGIMPDLFVPIDTTKFPEYFRQLIRKGTIRDFTMNYVDNNRNNLKQTYSSFNKFNENFKVSEDMLKDLLSDAEKAELKFNEEEFAAAKDDIALQIKALIARDIWDTSEFFEIINLTDEVFLQAVKLISNDKKYNDLLKGNN